MPDAPTHDSQVRQLVLRGFPPETAEAIVHAVDDRGGRLQTPDEISRAADVTDADIARARAFWYYWPAVPKKYKRILDARTVSENA